MVRSTWNTVHKTSVKQLWYRNVFEVFDLYSWFHVAATLQFEVFGSYTPVGLRLIEIYHSKVAEIRLIDYLDLWLQWLLLS